MQTFRKLIYFFLAFATMVVLADITISFVFDRLYQFNRYGMSGGTINYYLTLNKPEVLIMGSSRAHQNLIPDSINKSSFNLSHNGMSIAFQASLADILADKDALPRKYLILHVEPEDMMENVPELRKNIQYLKYYYYKNTFVKTELNKISRFEFLKYYFHSYIYNGTLFSLIKNAWNTRNNPVASGNGFERQERTADSNQLEIFTSQSEFAKRRKREPAFDGDSKNKGIFYLSHIIDLCQLKNVQLVLFTSPFYCTDCGYNYSGNGFSNWLKEKNIPNLDYSQSLIPELKNPGLWTDHAHLNVEGAKVFSAVFTRDFKKIRGAN